MATATTPATLMQPRIHQPMDLHPDAVDRGVRVRHVLLDTQAFVHDSHAGAGVEIVQRMGELGDFLAERLVQREQVRHRR